MEDNIYLYGPPGSGKSAAGRALAEALDLPFVDLDGAIEQAAGKPIPGIMAESGEAGFRLWEAKTLRQTVAAEAATAAGPAAPTRAVRGRVIALGGGALLRAENRRLAESTGRVVCLSAVCSTLEERLSADPVQRPLLRRLMAGSPAEGGELRRRLDSMLANRGEHYASFPTQVSTDGRSPEQVAGELQIALGRFYLRSMGRGMSPGYEAVVETGGLELLGERLRRAVRRPPEAVTAVVVTDEHVAPLYAGRVLESLRQAGFQTGPQAGYGAHLLVLPPGEPAKTLDSALRLWQGFLAAGMDRRGVVVALGGGVVGDLAGFAASTFLRGVDWAVVPTTLLAMVDASLGGKTGIDLPEGKNLAGAFHAPCLVLADPDTLATLPQRQFTAGLAEVLKHAIIADPELYRMCAAGPDFVDAHWLEVVSRAAAVKVRLVEDDPYEGGLRAALNLGHTAGHAVEAASGYRLLHGEAVAIGLAAEARLAERLGIARSGLADEVSQALTTLGLPTRIPPDVPRDEMVRRMRVDKKKNSGIVRFALPVEIGRVQVGVEVTDLERVFEEG